MSTNVNLLAKGLRNLAVLILLFIAAPITITMGFKALKAFENTSDIYIAYILLALAAILTLCAIYFGIKTINTLLKAIFNK
jgi:hypothetical protein